MKTNTLTAFRSVKHLCHAAIGAPHTHLKKLVLCSLFSVGMAFQVNAQATSPSVSALPFSFNTYSGSVFPSFLTVGKSGGTGLSTSDFTTDAANGSSGAQWRAEGANGISYQGGSGSTTPVGCFQVAMNASGATAIQVSWRVRTITDANSILTYSNVDLQWRNGTTGAWNTVSGFTFPSLLNNATFNATLPAAANNQANLRIRWVTSDGSYLGLGTSRDRVAIDDVSICGTPTVSASNNGPACAGSNVTLTCSAPGLSYSWSGPAGFTSNLQNPVISNLTPAKTGSYFITVTSGTCSNSASTVVSDYGSLTLQPATTPASVCPGSPVTLSVNSDLKFSNNKDLDIPDGGNVFSPVVVTGFSPATVTTGTLVSVTFNINHTFTNDLEVHLIAPNGADINLADNVGIGANFTNTTVVNSGAANGNFSILGNPFNGTYNSNSPFSTANGSPVNGTWNLRVNDGSGNFLSGDLINWTLSLQSNGLAYAWSSVPAGFSANVQSPVANPVVNTSYSVTAARNGCNYVTSQPAVVTMLTPQPAISSNSPVCLGDSIRLNGSNLAAGQASGNTYSWSGPDGFTSTAQNPVLPATAQKSGVYTLTITNASLCTAVTTYTVSINPLPSIAPSSNAPFCSATQNLSLSPNAPTGVTYSWSGPGGFTSTLQNPEITNATDLDGGNYKVRVTDGNGCVDSSILPVTIYPLPPVDVIVIGNTHLCTGQTTADLQATGAGANGSYAWSTTETTDLITVSTAGTYVVTGTDLHQCVNSNQVVMTESVPPAPPVIVAVGDVNLCTSDGGASFSPVTLHVTNYNSDLLWSTTETAQDIVVDYLDIFNVIYTDPAGCFGVSNSIITEPAYASTAPLNSQLSSDVQAACPGAPVTLTIAEADGSDPLADGYAGTNAQWVWYDEAGCGTNAVGTGTSVQVTPPTTPGSYHYYARAEGHCNTTSCAEITVDVKSLSQDPSTAVAAPGILCEGSQTALSINGGSLGTGANWVLYEDACANGTALQSSTTPGFNITPQSSGTHTYFIRAEGDCNNTICSMVSIDVKDSSAQASAVQTSSPEICEGGAVTLNANGGHLGRGAVWAWYENGCGTGLPLQSSASTSFAITPQTSGLHTYYLRAEGDCNNTLCQAVNINVNDSSEAAVSASASQSSICEGNFVTLTVNGGTLGANANWKWYAGSCSGTLAGIGASVNVTPATTTTYFVRAEGDCNTTICRSVTIDVKDSSVQATAIQSSLLEICEGSTVTLNANGGHLGRGAVWSWYENGCGTGLPLQSSASTSLAITPQTSGLHTYYLRAEGDCNNTLCQAVSINVKDSSEAAVSASASQSSICAGDLVTLSVSGGALGANANWKWYAGNCGGTLAGIGASVNVTPAASTTYFVRAEGDCNTTICRAVSVTVKTASTDPASASSNAPQNGICLGGTVTLNVAGGSLGNNASWVWYEDGCGNGTPVGTGASITLTPSYQGLHSYYVRAEGPCNVTSCAGVSVLVGTSSTAASSITTSVAGNSICNGNNIALTVNGGFLGTVAQWKWYSGTCGGTAVGTGPTITVSPSANTTYYVRAEGSCNTTACVSRAVNVSNTPPSGAPPTITSAPNGICNGNGSTVTCNAVNGATFYSWSAPNGTTFDGGNPSPYITTSNSVQVTFGNLPNGITGYDICVFAGNGCGNSVTKCRYIRGRVQSAQTISGNPSSCPNTSSVYSIVSLPGADSYTWTVTGAATINGGSSTLTTTSTSVTVNFLPGWTSGTLSVYGSMNCGYNGPVKTINIISTPVVPGIISGQSLVCPLGSYSYSIAPVAGATSYNWSTNVQGATIAGTGTSRTITFPSAIPAGSTISVTATGSCGTSAASVKSIATGLSNTPGTISGPGIGQCGQSGVSYSILPVPGATSYQWTASNGATINGLNNLTAVSVDFPSAFNTSTVSVTAINSCGNSAPQSISVTGAPGNPGVITGQGAVCTGTVYSYSIPGAAGATSYIWSGPPGSMILGGQNSASVQILFIDNSGGNVSVIASNSCGNSSTSNLAVQVVCRLGENMQSAVTDATLFPNPTTGRTTLKFESHVAHGCQVTITDVTGRVMQTQSLNVTEGMNMHELDLSSYAKGLYLIKVESAGEPAQLLKLTVQ